VGRCDLDSPAFFVSGRLKPDSEPSYEKKARLACANLADLTLSSSW